MAYSSNTTIASGSTDTVAVTFPYLSKNDVHVTINTAPVADNLLVWNSDSEIKLPTTPVIGDVVKVSRSTPKAGLAVIFSTPSIFNGDAINKANTQLLYIAQEAYDIGVLEPEELDAAIAHVNTVSLQAQASADNAAVQLAAALAQALAAAASAEDAAASAALAEAASGVDVSSFLTKAGNLSGIADAATARTNIGAASAADIVSTAVRYDAAQSLNSGEKAQATTNIGAFPVLGGTISGTLGVTGLFTAAGGLKVTTGDASIYGYGSNTAAGLLRFNTAGTRYLAYGVGASGGDYWLFSGAHVYSAAGRLWGTSDFASVPSPGTTSMRLVSGGYGTSTTEESPYFVTSFYSDGAGAFWTTRRYIQYYIAGTWYTAGFA